MKIAALLALLALVLAIPAHATLPEDAVIIVLKTAKVTLKKQYRDPVTKALKTTVIGRYNSAIEAKEALRLLPPLTGGLMYRLDIPEAYANVVPCVVPHGSGAICTDAIDSRLFIQ